MLSHVLGILRQETILQIERKLEGGDARKLLHTGVFTQRNLYTEEFVYTQKVLPREVFILRSFCAQTFWSFYTQKLLHREVFTQRALTHRRVYTQKLLHREAFAQRVFTHESLYTQRNLYTDALSHRETSTQKETFTQRSLYTE